MESLPDFLLDTAVDMQNIGFDFTCKGDNKGTDSTLALSAKLTIGPLTLQIDRTQKRPASYKPTDKGPRLEVSTTVQASITALPRPPPLPLVGQLDQPFTLKFQWEKSADKSRAESEFMLMQGATPIVSSKPKNVKSSKAKVLPAGPATAQGTAGSGDPHSTGPAPAPAPAASTTPAQPENVEMKPYNKKMNAVSVSNIGLDFKSESQTLTIKMDATVQLGPLEASLLGFGMDVELPKLKTPPTGSTEIGSDIFSAARSVADLATDLRVHLSLDGLAVAMTGSHLEIAGVLERLPSGFEGGIGVTFKPWTFAALGTTRRSWTKRKRTASSLLCWCTACCWGRY